MMVSEECTRDIWGQRVPLKAQAPGRGQRAGAGQKAWLGKQSSRSVETRSLTLGRCQAYPGQPVGKGVGGRESVIETPNFPSTPSSASGLFL
jgi:hypothetical protein